MSCHVSRVPLDNPIPQVIGGPRILSIYGTVVHARPVAAQAGEGPPYPGPRRALLT